MLLCLCWFMSRILTVLFVSLFFITFPIPLHAETSWIPQDTHALIVGVLNWQDKTLGTFSSRHRKDRELYNLLIKRGVPKKNIVLLLDEKATLSRILRTLKEVSSKAKSWEI